MFKVLQSQLNSLVKPFAVFARLIYPCWLLLDKNLATHRYYWQKDLRIAEGATWPLPWTNRPLHFARIREHSFVYIIKILQTWVHPKVNLFILTALFIILCPIMTHLVLSCSCSPAGFESRYWMWWLACSNMQLDSERSNGSYHIRRYQTYHSVYIF